jgi:hypothetical protein
VTGSEAAFLALGLIVGVSIGAALVWLRTRSRSGREVRVTVAPDAIPKRRSATLSEESFNERAAAARGGPADHGPITVPTFAVASAGSPQPSRASGGLLAVPMGGGVDPMMAAIGTRATATAVLDRPHTMARADADDHDVASAIGDSPAATGDGAPSTADVDTDDASLDGGTAPVSSSPCGEERTKAQERCEVADRARAEAQRALDALRATQRAYDDHTARAEEATSIADPRAVRTAKDAAQQAFRAARAVAVTTESVDEAARTWLAEINRINGAAREAAATAAREQHAAMEAAAALERLSVEADAARITAENADAACLAARVGLAACEEAAARTDTEAAAGTAVPRAPSEEGDPGPWSDEDPAIGDDAVAVALRTGGTPTIFRLLAGDRAVLLDLVERLAGDGPDERRRWQAVLVDLVDAILATAIEGIALDLPEDHPFWGPFTSAQQRDIVAALASLGYRYDGLGGWQDGRVPSQRDLSLALGYAGLDPMRIRHWPDEAEMTALYADVRVAAAEYLATSAGDLTLGELVTMLGRRADGLTDAWNEWGRIRPLLLEDR